MSEARLHDVTSHSVTAAHRAVIDDPKYGSYERTANGLYSRHHLHDDVALVMLKVAFVDSTNSTNLRMSSDFSYAHWAEAIVRLDFDRRVQDFDSQLVLDVAGIAGRNHLSFASKYVTHHNFHTYGRDDYAIFDSVVRRFLPAYLRVYVIKRTQYELGNYLTFRNAIDELASAGVSTFRTRGAISTISSGGITAALSASAS